MGIGAVDLTITSKDAIDRRYGENAGPTGNEHDCELIQNESRFVGLHRGPGVEAIVTSQPRRRSHW